MATTNRRIARNTARGTNAMGIQKKINTDYAVLAKDYEKLLIELWRKPGMKWILGGLTLGVAVPLLMRALGQEKVIPTFVIDNLQGIKTKVQGLVSDEDVVSQ